MTDPLYAAKASGKPIVLYVSNDTPVELIYGSGCFPLQLPTAAREAYPLADKYLEPGFEPMVRAALEQLLQGELSCASLLVLPRSNDAWQRMYYYLCELARSFGERMPEPFLYDLQKLPTASSARYNLRSTELLAEKLHALGQVSSTADAIALYNRVRKALSDVLCRRYERPRTLAGADAFDLLTAAQREDPVRTEALLRELPVAAPVSGTPTLLIGSTHDSSMLHRRIAANGGQVVHDFHTRGDWSFGPPIPEDVPPLEALSRHYHQSLSTRSHPAPLPALLEAAAVSGAQAAIFFYYSEEEALTWDHPAQSAALHERGIRTLLLPRQPYPIHHDIEERLHAFFHEKQT